MGYIIKMIIDLIPKMFYNIIFHAFAHYYVTSYNKPNNLLVPNDCTMYDKNKLGIFSVIQ